jgi:hypothetical protein
MAAWCTQGFEKESNSQGNMHILYYQIVLALQEGCVIGLELSDIVIRNFFVGSIIAPVIGLLQFTHVSTFHPSGTMPFMIL